MPPRAATQPAGGKGARRRQELIDAAHAAFVERGYSAVGVSDITARVGVSHGAFYRYFDSKRDILDAVVDDCVERFMEVTDPGGPPADVTSPAEFLDGVRGAAERVLALVLEEPGLARLVVLEATSVDDELTHRLLGLMDLAAGLVTPYLERAKAAGVLRAAVETDVLADAAVGMLLPALVLAFRGELDDAARARQVDVLIGVLAAGIKKSDASLA